MLREVYFELIQCDYRLKDSLEVKEDEKQSLEKINKEKKYIRNFSFNMIDYYVLI